ncbi:hypothetical protein J6590_010639 [Homalodisca vitripennis]|nr:hypothetical protein J6590_010639 [Homalodisca vitripennis]
MTVPTVTREEGPGQIRDKSGDLDSWGFCLRNWRSANRSRRGPSSHGESLDPKPVGYVNVKKANWQTLEIGCLHQPGSPLSSEVRGQCDRDLNTLSTSHACWAPVTRCSWE